jgi:APA family basic amino acid/polyamine antiporter
MSTAHSKPAPKPARELVRRLGLFDATMLVMGGIIGTGIFINPYVVARQVHTPELILSAWIAGGVIALAGAFIYAELGELLPEVGGQYAYLREAYDPLLGFLYGWTLLLVIQTGGMAAVTITFARYFSEVTHVVAPDWLVALVVIILITTINCLGVRAGGSVQSGLMVLKIACIAAFVIAGLMYVKPPQPSLPALANHARLPGLISQFGAAMVPVLFAYGGWQTTSFVAGEMKNPVRDLPRGLLLGVIGVIAIYTAVNFVCLRALGPENLAATTTPASAVMRAAFGATGGRLIALAIALSALGFLSQGILTAPRVYFAMAEDGAFFRRIAWVHPTTHVPVYAIVLQSIWTLVIVFSGTYEQILSYVVCMDWVFFGLSASSLFVLRRRGRAKLRVPGHPVTTIVFCAVCVFIVLNTIYRYPANTLIAVGILLSGIPVYYLWKRTQSA